MEATEEKGTNITNYKQSIYGNLKHPYIMLAPLSGVTDVPFRLIARKFGCKFAFTEMVDVNGIHYNNVKTFKMFDRPKEDAPLGAQIVGQDEEKMLAAAKLCEDKGFRLVDINAGCPARKVVKGGKGSALLKDPKHLGNIIRRLTNELTIPVTVKIRSGWDKDSKNFMEVARIAQEEGAKAICIHTRTQNQMYKGKPEHDDARQIKEALSIPVIVSGNMFNPEDIKEVLDQTLCDGAMIARGVLGRPWIFKEVEDYLTSGSYENGDPTFQEIKETIKEHFMLCLDHYSKYLAFKRMYKHICWYLKPYRNLDSIMKEYSKVKTPEELFIFIDRLHLEDGRRMEI